MRTTPPHRIAIIGATGSGKSTLAGYLATTLGQSHVELDALFWGRNWTKVDPEVFLAETKAALQPDRWVVDGNYTAVREFVWAEADTLVWMNYPLWIVLKQLFARTIRRTIRKEVLWNGNVEDWREHFLSKESFFFYAIRHTYRFRRTYRAVFQDPRYAHIRRIELRSPAETRSWLAGLK
jgi:adenylate kinase family enzyme